MATVIDALVVTLGLNAKGFKTEADKAKKTTNELAGAAESGAKRQEAAERRLAAERARRNRDLDRGTRDAGRGFASMRGEVLKLVAVFTAGVGIKNFIADTINSAVQLGYLSQNLGMSTQQIKAYQLAAERAGGTQEGMAQQFRESADALAQLRSGGGPNQALQEFFRWGGSSSDLKDGNTYLLARAKIIHEMFQVDPTRAAYVARQMGISDDQFNFFKQGPQAILALVDAQKKRAAITEAEAQKALELKNRWLDLKESLGAVAVKFLTAMLPALSKFTDLIATGADKLAENKEKVGEFAEELTRFLETTDWSSVVQGAKDFAASVRSIADSIREVIDRWDEWRGKPKVQTPGVTKMPGALRFGTTEDLNRDNAATGKPLPKAQAEPTTALGRAGKAFSDNVEMALARTLASWGVQAAKEFVRDKTGKDDYLAGPRKAPAAAPAAPAAGGAAAKSVVSKLIGMGWSAEQAAGIAGSFQQESSLNPNAVNPTSGAYGIGQWLAPRRADFKAWAGKDIRGSSLDEQLAFFQYEVTKGKEKAAGDKLRAARTAAEAARIHSEEYERPGRAEANILARQRYAQQHAAQARTAGAGASLPPTVNRSSSSRTETHIGQIVVQTPATDAEGIARSIRPAVEKYSFSMQANTGVN